MYKPDIPYRQHIIDLAEKLGNVMGCETTLLDGYDKDDYKMVIVCAFSILQNWVFYGLYFYRSKHLTAEVVKNLSQRYDKGLITKEQLNLNHINYMGAFNLLDNLAKRFGEEMDMNGFKPYQMKLYEDEQGKVQVSKPDEDWYDMRIEDRALCSFSMAITSVQIKKDNFEDTLVFHFDIGYSFQRILNCVICGERTLGYGHNALPVAEGRCCDKCNPMVLIARFKLGSSSKGIPVLSCGCACCCDCGKKLTTEKIEEEYQKEIAEAEAEYQKEIAEAEAEYQREIAEAELLNLKSVAEKKEKPKTKAQLQAEETRRANAALKAEKKRREDYEKQLAEVSARNAQKNKNKQKEILRKKKENQLKCMGLL
jgi:hypothetical protein